MYSDLKKIIISKSCIPDLYLNSKTRKVLEGNFSYFVSGSIYCVGSYVMSFVDIVVDSYIHKLNQLSDRTEYVGYAKQPIFYVDSFRLKEIFSYGFHKVDYETERMKYQKVGNLIIDNFEVFFAIEDLKSVVALKYLLKNRILDNSNTMILSEISIDDVPKKYSGLVNLIKSHYRVL